MHPMHIRTLIVDDEAHIRRSLSAMLSEECPDVQVVGTAGGVDDGLLAIEKYHPDLVLLDIKMNDGSGLDLLNRASPVNFKTIFVTAHEEFAIQAFRYSAADYLLKPVSAEDLKIAIEKVSRDIGHDYSTLLKVLEENLNAKVPAERKIVLKSHDSLWLIKLRDILYCEADTSYTRFFLQNGTQLLVTGNLMEFEVTLKSAGFFRSHKSYLVNIAEVLRFEKADGGFIVMSNGEKIPVASRKKDELMQLFRRFT
jgi:two-component system LytT family response regulator